MNEHVGAWIAAYYDGELPAGRRARVAAHLRDCTVCRAQLEELQGLSALLREAPIHATQRAASRRFAAQVVGQLPSAAPRAGWGRLLATGFLAVPLLLIGIWMVVQAVVSLGSLTILAGVSAAISTGRLPTLSLEGAQPGLLLLNRLGLFLTASPWLISVVLALFCTIAYLGLAITFALLIWGWIAAWWANHNLHRAS